MSDHGDELSEPISSAEFTVRFTEHRDCRGDRVYRWRFYDKATDKHYGRSLVVHRNAPELGTVAELFLKYAARELVAGTTREITHANVLGQRSATAQPEAAPSPKGEQRTYGGPL